MESSQLVKNLRFLMEKRMETANAVAVSSGIKASTLMRLLDGSSSAPRNSTLQALAMHFGVNPEKLLKAKLSIEIEELVEHKNITEPVSLLTEKEVFLVYCWNEADTTDNEDKLYKRLSNDRTWLPAPPDQELIDVIKSNPNSILSPIFAFKVKGDAMAPTFCDGDIVFVRYSMDDRFLKDAPPELIKRLPENIQIKNGDFVLGWTLQHLSDSEKKCGSVVVRQYCEDDVTEERFLLSTNPNWPGERVLKCHQLIGKIVGLYRKF